MKTCREISVMVSESMDREFPLRERIGLWMHLKMCTFCAGFAADMRRIRRVVREHFAVSVSREVAPTTDEKRRPQLSRAARDRIAAAIQTEL